LACQGSSRKSCPYNAWAAYRLRTSISPSGHRPIVKFRLPVLSHRLLTRRAWRETAVALSIFALVARRWHRAARPNHSLKWSANGLPPGPVCGCGHFSTARAWRQAVVAHLAQTLGRTKTFLRLDMTVPLSTPSSPLRETTTSGTKTSLADQQAQTLTSRSDT
jgi:hypothetical protein